MITRALVTGGAGYKGTLLVQALLEKGVEVTVLDNFMYGFEPILGFASNSKFNVVNKDIRNLIESDVSKYDIVYHLAGISGYPACEANPHSAQTINVDSTKLLCDLLGKEQILVYASTTSMYGKSEKIIDETYEPTPVSLYGITKYRAEQICMERKNSVSLRFATLFGASLKMRCDLLVNDFAYKAATERSVILFDSGSVRTFLHLKDAIAAYLLVIGNADRMVDKVFNVGSNTMNHSKKEIGLMIREQLGEVAIIETELEDPDRRNFVINFDKIAKLGFAPTITLKEGIGELLRLYRWYRPYKPYQTI